MKLTHATQSESYRRKLAKAVLASPDNKQSD